MPDTTIDHAAILHDIRTLNHLFSARNAAPALDPARFKVVESTSRHLVVRSVCCGTHYMADKHLDMGQWFYSKFAPAEPRERTVIDWVWA